MTPKKKGFGDKMCEENKFGPDKREMGYKMHHMAGHMGHKGHMDHDMKKKMIMKKIFIKKVMEHLSEADKKKILVKKMEMKISMAEHKAEIMKQKKSIVASKLDMESSMAEQKVELLKMVRDMLKEE